MSSLTNPYLAKEETGSEKESDSPQVSVSGRQTWDVDPDFKSWFSPPAVCLLFFSQKKAVAGGGGKEGNGAWEQDACSLK